MFGHNHLIEEVSRTAFVGASALTGGLITLALVYCLTLLLVAAIAGRKGQPIRSSQPVTRFAILIPAHDEELVIGATLGWLSQVNYPPHLVNVVVVADNCTDATAAIARAAVGVRILERRDPLNPGKPGALNWAIRQGTVEVEECDAVVIMDADTQMDREYLGAMDAAFQRSVGRPFAAQGRYDVLNPGDGWRAALMAGALSLVHVVRPLARDAMRLSVGLKGNGMCFSRDILKEMPWNPLSLTEDIELGIDLIERKSMRVEFVAGAIVRAQMPVSQAAAAGQRRRWEGGRWRIVRQRAPRLLRMSLGKANGVAFDAAIDLLLPPLAELCALVSLWGVLTVAGVAIHELSAEYAVWWAIAALSLIIYVIGGFAVGGAPKSAYAALIQAPFYAIWKLAAVVTRIRSASTASGAEAWVRTDRVAIAPVSAESPVARGGGGVE